jgi:hypothetical protein
MMNIGAATTGILSRARKELARVRDPMRIAEALALKDRGVTTAFGASMVPPG